uniref:Uncharacterized protein n=1 Tax=Rhodopseudomonas palustris (strain BisA53) TaxID=316055 RepID=Q07S53_RHOP5
MKWSVVSRNETLNKATGGAGQMTGTLIGIALLAIAAMMIVVGRPDKQGNTARFLGSGWLVLIYPALVLACFALGVAELFFSFEGV